MKNILLLTALFLATALYSQTTLTIGEIYDFNINDEFHSSDVYPGQTPNAIRMKIMEKHYSAANDTVFYTRSFNNYHTVFSPDPEPHLDYVVDTYTDTVFYTNLDDSIFCDPTDTLCVSITDTTICGIPSNGWEIMGFEQYRSKVYGKGLGWVRDVFWEDGSPEDSYDRQMFYFKKDGMECGIPDSTVTSVDEYSLPDANIDIYPNPFSDRFNIRFADDQPFRVIRIFDLAGVEIYRTTIEDRSHVVIDNIKNQGLYILKIETGGRSYISKIIKK